MEWVATGVLGEGSAYTKDAYVWRVVAPLFAPRKTLGLSYSQRVGRGQTYGLDDLDAFQSVVRSALAGVGSEDELARIASAADTLNHKIIEVRGGAHPAR